jgi:hypothetical protein
MVRRRTRLVAPAKQNHDVRILPGQLLDTFVVVRVGGVSQPLDAGDCPLDPARLGRDLRRSLASGISRCSAAPTSLGIQEAVDRGSASGGGGIRTLDGRKPPITVFETAAFNHSATPPGGGRNTSREDPSLLDRLLHRRRSLARCNAIRGSHVLPVADPVRRPLAEGGGRVGAPHAGLLRTRGRRWAAPGCAAGPRTPQSRTGMRLPVLDTPCPGSPPDIHRRCAPGAGADSRFVESRGAASSSGGLGTSSIRSSSRSATTVLRYDRPGVDALPGYTFRAERATGPRRPPALR